MSSTQARFIALFCAFGLGMGCGTEVSGDQASYRVSAQGTVANGSVNQFTNAQGWEIKLTKAQVLVGPIYFYSGQARASFFERLIGINIAYAGGTHSQFQSGRTLGEMTRQYGVDLLGKPSTLVTDQRGESGKVRSVELHVQNPGQVEAGNDLVASAKDTYEFAGMASKDDKTISFTVSITLPEDGTHQIIDSIPTQIELDDGVNLMLKLHVDRFFRDVDFDSFEQSTEPITIEPGTQAYTTMFFSLRSRDAFVWENTQ